MKKFETSLPYSGGKIIIMGAWGVSGRSALALALKQKMEVILYDSAAVPKDMTALIKKNKITVISSLTDEDGLKEKLLQNIEIDVAIISPGFPLNSPEIEELSNKNIPFCSELEWGLAFFPDSKKLGITGTDGKSSVVYYVTQLLEAFNVPAIACGNYGLPLSDLALQELNKPGSINGKSVLVIELSSYQLEMGAGDYFDAGLITNIASDHQNRYNDMQDYIETKLRIYHFLKPSSFLYLTNWGKIKGDFQLNIDAHCKRVLDLEGWNSRQLLFLHNKWKTGNREMENYKQTAFFGGIEIRQYAFPQCHVGDLDIDLPSFITNKIRQKNIVSALVLWEQIVKPDIKEPEFQEKIETALKNLKDLEHRLEFVAEKKSIHFYNDSKATTIQAVKAALDSLLSNMKKSSSKKIHLLMGGQDKGASFKDLQVVLEGYPKNIIFYSFGEAAENINKSLDLEKEFTFKSMEEAFKSAVKNAKKDDIVLLSPACTSWDTYESYKHRGEHFKKLVKKI